jgi:outer membrane protein OmpA-like peptidoglycan-associated protein
MNGKLQVIVAQALSVLLLMGCASWNNTEKGTAVGGGTGAAVGAVLGNKTGQAGKGAAIGAVVGGATGAAIGIYMDRQAKKIEEIKDVEVEREGEMIKVTFESGILFGFDSDKLTSEAQTNVLKFADILNEFPDTNISIEGHTDSRGSANYNQKLSERRALAVRDFLVNQKVSDKRLFTIGHGLSQPIADNNTDEGRAKNRRVEVKITANEALVDKAEKGQIKN